MDFFQDRYGLLVIYRRPGDELQLQRSITSNYYKAAKLVRSFSTPGLRKVINAILEKDEFELLASILKAILTIGDWRKSGVEMALVGSAAAIFGYIIGVLLGSSLT